jgi:DNA-binding transcriptional regulator YhcF (GntR family)
MTEPHYLRIAREIGDRIRAGELRAGDTIPSTRRIVQEWHVAMATATRVIEALKAEGLVDAVPGRGTIVKTPSSAADRSRRTRREPTLAEVLDTAVAIADEDGLDLLTMRRLAGALGLPTVSVYRYAASRTELTLRMADHVFADASWPDLPLTSWRERLETGARVFRGVFARHPWAADAFSLTRPQVLPNVLPLAEWNLQTLRTMGLSVDDMMFAHINLFGLVVSMSRVSAAERQALTDTGESIDDFAERQAAKLPEMTVPADLPAFRHVIEQGFDYDLDAVFEFGLSTFLDGLAARRPA